jgi:hypothetical protein
MITRRPAARSVRMRAMSVRLLGEAQLGVV